MSTDWKGANLEQIVEAELRPFLGRVSVSGPDIIIDGRMVQTLALVLHELATNAAKYGSLSRSRQDTLKCPGQFREQVLMRVSFSAGKKAAVLTWSRLFTKALEVPCLNVSSTS